MNPKPLIFTKGRKSFRQVIDVTYQSTINGAWVSRQKSL